MTIKTNQLESPFLLSDKAKLDGISTGAEVNPPFASQAVAEAGVDNAQIMTALRVKQAIQVFASSAGESNTASNLGSGDGQVFGSKSGVDLRFRSLVAGTNVTISQNTNEITINATGGGGDVDSVNSQTGVVVLDADDIEPTATRIWFTSAQETKLSGIATGAEVNPSVISQAEAEAGTATTARLWTAERVKQAIDALAPSGGGVDEFRFVLPAAATLADRIPLVTGLPSGWTVDTADNAGEGQFGASAETLVITWSGSLGTKIAQVYLWQVNTCGPTSTQGIQKIETSGVADEKTITAKTIAAVYLT
jgi:Cu/Ag efflux protein CusF